MATIIRLNFSAYLDPHYPHLEQTRLGQLGNYLYWPQARPGQKAAALADELIVLTNSNTSAQLLAEIPPDQIKLLIHPNSGYDNFAPEYVAQAKFPIILGHQLRALAVSEFILAAIFTAYTPLPWRQAWDPQRCFPGRQLIGAQHFLLSGFGHIGQRVAQHLTRLGATVEAFDPFADAALRAAAQTDPHLRPASWDQIPWQQLTGIILAASLNPTSWHQINSAVVGKLGPQVILINAARGPLVDPDALKLFLQGEQHQAFIDTWENEPHPNFDWRHPRLHASSHVAGVYPSLGQRMLDYMAQVITDEQQLAPDDFRQKYQAEWLNLRLRHNEQGAAYLI